MPRPQDSRQRLVQAALNLFSRLGYHNTSIADILRESGCKRGTLYHYFSSKEDLGYAVIDEMLRVLTTQGGGRHLRSNEHPIDRLVKMVDELPGVVQLPAGGSLMGGVAARMATVNEGFRRRVREGFEALIQEGEELLQQGVADGHIVHSVDSEQLAHEFVIVCMGVQFAALLGLRDVICDDARSRLKEYLNSLRR
jgi:TetR/AcrR family transcriptional repressor of nem operon